MNTVNLDIYGYSPFIETKRRLWILNHAIQKDGLDAVASRLIQLAEETWWGNPQILEEIEHDIFYLFLLDYYGAKTITSVEKEKKVSLVSQRKIKKTRNTQKTVQPLSRGKPQFTLKCVGGNCSLGFCS